MPNFRIIQADIPSDDHDHLLVPTPFPCERKRDGWSWDAQYQQQPYERTDRRTPDDAVMLAEEELREAQIGFLARKTPHPSLTGRGTPITEAFRDGSAALRAHYARLTKKEDTP